MAYTYDDFVAAANKAGLMNQFSETDLVTAQKNPEYGLSLLSLKQDELNATTAEQRLLATEAANQLRKSYGTTSALDTQIQNVQDQIGSFGSFRYDNETAYQKALKAVTDPKEFSYDMESDPQYGALRQSMLRERDRSVADTLARASAASGGVPSSYAVTAAQQAGDYYTGKLGDAGITLYQNALDKYMKERNLDMSRLEALRSDRDDDYQIWMNRLGLLQNQLEQLQGQRADALTDAGNAQNKYQLLLQELDAMKQEEAAKAAAVDGSVSGAMLAAQTALNLNAGATGDKYGAETVALLKQLYPSGVITDRALWDSILQAYGPEFMEQSGLRLAPTPTSTAAGQGGRTKDVARAALY